MWVNPYQLPCLALEVLPGISLQSCLLELQPHFYYPQPEVERPRVLEVSFGQGGWDGAEECLKDPRVGWKKTACRSVSVHSCRPRPGQAGVREVCECVRGGVPGLGVGVCAGRCEHVGAHESVWLGVGSVCVPGLRMCGWVHF